MNQCIIILKKIYKQEESRLKILKGIVLLVLIVMSSLFLWNVLEDAGEDGETNEEADHVEGGDDKVIYDTTEIIENKVSLGAEDAEKEVLFVLDYKCPYCKEWYRDTFPQLKEAFIDKGEVKFFVQSQVLLSIESLLLTDFTQKVETLYPEKYFELIDRIIIDSELEHWGTEKYITELTEDLALVGWEEVELDYDIIRKTRQTTRGLEVDVVPTIYVNGRKVSDSNDFEEISRLINETKNAKWNVQGELCEEGANDC